MKFTLLLFLTLISLKCSRSKDPIYTNSQMWNMAYDFDSSIELVPITTEEKRILCIHYGEGCKKRSGKRIKIRKVELIVVQFKTPAQAKEEAKKIGQYYARNWLFDDARGEPVLESFIKSVYDAKLSE